MTRWTADPAEVRPMLASLEEPPIRQVGWVYEPKYDGIRAIVDLQPDGKHGVRVAIYSRNGHEKHRQFPEVVDALEMLGRRLEAPLLLDGEIVAVDSQGTPLGFQHIQGRIHLTSDTDIARAAKEHPAVLVLFDLLRDGDEDMRGEPLAARRLRLQTRIRPTAAIRRVVRLSEIATDDGRALLQRAKAEKWEGLIGKDGHSLYQSGRRTPAWRKLKLLQQQEFVIGGWTAPRQTRLHFGALLIGYYDDTGLRWAGSVGTGFDQAELDSLAAKLAKRAVDTSPFVDPIKTLEARHWVKPELVAELRFTEWTSDGLLRHPVYLGLRADKAASAVVRETASPASPSRSAAIVGHATAAAAKRRADAARAATSSLAAARAGSPTPRVGPAPSSPSRAAVASAASVARASAPTKSGASPASARRASAKAAATPAVRMRGRRARAVDTLDIATSDALIDALTDLERMKKDGDLALPSGDNLRVTNLAKVFWPDLGITKGELLRYYVRVSPFLLPAVDDRPMVMKRFPNGVGKPAFYQQRHPEAAPPGVRRITLPDDVDPIDEEGPRDRLIGGSLTTLLYMTQLGAISQDPWFSRVSSPFHPDAVALDLDPGDDTSFARVLDVARWIKEELEFYGIPGVPKTSGASGLHIYIPLPKQATYDTGQVLCQMIATVVATKHPKVATVERMVKKRPRGTVYVDYLQNILGKTLATAYSARASEYAGVSTPLTWDEIATDVDPRAFTIRSAPERFAAVGDLWRALRDGKPVDLKAVLAKGR